MAASASATGIKATATLLAHDPKPGPVWRRDRARLHNGERARRQNVMNRFRERDGTGRPWTELLLQQPPHQFRLPSRSRLVEDIRQMRSRRSDRDAEPIGGGLPAVALDDLQRERGLSRREAETLLQGVETRPYLRLGIGNQQ